MPNKISVEINLLYTLLYIFFLKVVTDEDQLFSFQRKGKQTNNNN